MWCKNCNIETEQEKCPLCGSTTEEDTPIEVFWCDSCRVPVLQKVSQADKGICPKCKNKIKHMASDIRPVFPEERLLLELLIAKPSLCVKLVCDISSIFVSYFTFLNVTAFFSFFSKRGCGGKSFFFFLNHF